MQGWKWDQSCSTGKCGTVKIDYRVYVLRVKYIKSAIIVLTEQQFKVWSRTSNERTTESCSVLVNATLPISYFIDQRKLLFWKKLAIHNNNFLASISRLLQNRFYAIGSLYDITTMSASVGQIKSAVWSKFIETESF